MALCAQCGKPLARDAREFKGQSGTRLSADLWLTHLEKDPFCSTECCRAAFGAAAPPHEKAARCTDCGKQLGKSRNLNAGPRCRACGRAERTRRYFSGADVCSHCGIAKASYTSGCWTCGERRRRREARAAAMSGPCPPALGDVRAEESVPGAAESHTEQEVAAA